MEEQFERLRQAVDKAHTRVDELREDFAALKRDVAHLATSVSALSGVPESLGRLEVKLEHLQKTLDDRRGENRQMWVWILAIVGWIFSVYQLLIRIN